MGIINFVTDVFAIIGALTVAYQCYRLLYPPAKSHKLPEVNPTTPMPAVKPPKADD